MNYSLLTLIPVVITCVPLHAENNNLLLATVAATSAAIGGAVGYYCKQKPPHTLDALEKRADLLHKNVESIESADPLALAVNSDGQAIARITAFETDADALLKDSFDTTFMAHLTPDERARAEALRKIIMEKQRLMREKYTMLANIAPHADLMRTLNNSPLIPIEQIGSRIRSAENIKRNIDLIGTRLQKSRSAAGAEKMAQIHAAAEQRITYLMAQRTTLEQSAEYARELAELRVRTAHEQAQAQRIQEERTTKEMLDGFTESQRRLEKADRLVAEANAKQAAAAALTLSAQSTINRAEDREQAARIELANEQLKTAKLELAVQELKKARSEATQEYYAQYLRRQAAQRADASKAFTLLEQEIKSPSMNPENHQEWRKVLENKAEAARETAIPTCAICAEELTGDLFVTHCDQGAQKTTHEYHHACLKRQKESAGGKPITCALCRAHIANHGSI